MKKEFTAAEVSRLAGFEKPWMLAHLERENIFVRESYTDRRHGRARKYTFGDLLVLRAINRMLELGARPARIRDVIRKISSLEGFGTRKAAEHLVRSLGTKLFVSKDDVYLVRGDNEVIDLVSKGQLAFGFMIDLHLVAGQVADVVSLYSKRRQGNLKADFAVLEELCLQSGI